MLISIHFQSYSKCLSITIDDLPFNRPTSFQELDIYTNNIISGLKQYGINATLFVNEKGLELDDKTGRIGVLKKWVAYGHSLGNHTYSHISMHQTPLDQFEKDILKGEQIIKKLMSEDNKPLHYFRFPYNHAGLTVKSRNEITNFLMNHGYEIAPMTIDTDDWIFDRAYVEAIKNNDLEKQKELVRSYLKHTQAKFEFYDAATITIFNRDIDHIWILHANTINAETMSQLLRIAVDRGYCFKSLEEVMKDPAYQLTDNYYKNFGPSWLYRWDYSNGLKVDWRHEPEPNI